MRRTATALPLGMLAGRSQRWCGWRPKADSPGRCWMRAAGLARTRFTSPRWDCRCWALTWLRDTTTTAHRPGWRQSTGSRPRASNAVLHSHTPSAWLVSTAEDEPRAVVGRLTAADAGSLLRLAIRRDDARCGGSGGLDVVLALGLAAVERPGPAGRDGRGEFLPGVDRDGPLVAELGGPPQQQVLECGQLEVQPRRSRVQRDRRLLVAEPGGH